MQRARLSPEWRSNLSMPFLMRSVFSCCSCLSRTSSGRGDMLMLHDLMFETCTCMTSQTTLGGTCSRSSDTKHVITDSRRSICRILERASFRTRACRPGCSSGCQCAFQRMMSLSDDANPECCSPICSQVGSPHVCSANPRFDLHLHPEEGLVVTLF